MDFYTEKLSDGAWSRAKPSVLFTTRSSFFGAAARFFYMRSDWLECPQEVQLKIEQQCGEQVNVIRSNKSLEDLRESCMYVE